MQSDKVAANAFVDFSSKTASETPMAISLQKCCMAREQHVCILVIRENRICFYVVTDYPLY